MEFKERSDKKILDDIKSAGQTFLGLRMEDLLLRINELDDTDIKKQLIQEYYEHQIGTHDDKFDGTRTRVNSAIRIIATNKVLFALNVITNSNFRVPPDAVLKASETIAKNRAWRNKTTYFIIALRHRFLYPIWLLQLPSHTHQYVSLCHFPKTGLPSIP